MYKMILKLNPKTKVSYINVNNQQSGLSRWLISRTLTLNHTQRVTKDGNFTRFEEHRQPKINSLQRRVLLLVSKQKVLGLQITMHNSIHMTHHHNLSDRPRNSRSRTLRVMPPRDDPVEKLAAFAELHDQMHALAVLVSRPELHDVGVVGERGHDRDLAADVLDVDGGAELPLGDRFAGQGFAGLAVGAEVGDPELAAA